MRNNQRGITIITLVVTITIIGIIAGIGITQGNQIINKANLQTLNTNMLLVQAKSKIISERNSFDEDENPFKGQKLSDVENNEKVNNLKAKGVISEDEEYYDSYYIWKQEEMYELELNTITLKDAFYIVNYHTEEVIFSDGFKYVDGNTYYKLSETMNLN